MTVFAFALLATGCAWLRGGDVAGDPTPDKPEVWMAALPSDVLTADLDGWPFVRAHIDGIKFWTQHVDMPMANWPYVGEAAGPEVAPDAFAQLARLCRREGIPLIIEKGCWPQAIPNPPDSGYILLGGEPGPLDDGTAATRAAVNEIDRLDRIEAMGGQVRFLDVDGPIRHLHLPLTGGQGLEIEEAAAVFVDYMLQVQAAHPRVEFFALTNLPNWGYRGEPNYGGTPGWGDYFVGMETFVRLAAEAGAPLRGITVDNPYDYALGRIYNPAMPRHPNQVDWIERILDVEHYAHDHDLEFNLIFNTQGGGAAGMEQYCRETLEFIDLYLERGGRPDRYIIQSWYKHPTFEEMTPETEPYTFTWLVREVLCRVKGECAE